MSACVAAFALRVSPPGSGAIHLIWLGGSEAETILRRLTNATGDLAAPRLRLGKISAKGVAIDEILWRRMLPAEFPFPGPLFEISIHGSPAILEATLGALREAGASILDTEAFLQLSAKASNLDACRLEGWRALLDARTEAGASLFLDQVRGAFSQEIHSLLADLDLARATDTLRIRVQSLLDHGRAALALRNPQRIALCGRPNAGKSTLFNALVGYERVLVSAAEGTTRDPVEEFAALGDYPVRLIDTAGLRESADPLEREGIRRTLEIVSKADLIVFVWDAREAWTPFCQSAFELLPAARTIRFSFRQDEILAARIRFEQAILQALALPAPAPRNGPAPTNAEQCAALDQVRSALRDGRDPRPILRALCYPANPSC